MTIEDLPTAVVGLFALDPVLIFGWGFLALWPVYGLIALERFRRGPVRLSPEPETCELFRRHRGAPERWHLLSYRGAGFRAPSSPLADARHVGRFRTRL